VNKEFANIISMMLQVVPERRPSSKELLSYPIIRRKLAEFQIEINIKTNPDLLKTLTWPANIDQLNK